MAVTRYVVTGYRKHVSQVEWTLFDLFVWADFSTRGTAQNIHCLYKRQILKLKHLGTECSILSAADVPNFRKQFQEN